MEKAPYLTGYVLSAEKDGKGLCECLYLRRKNRNIISNSIEIQAF